MSTDVDEFPTDDDEPTDVDDTLEELPTEAFTAVRKRPVEVEARRVQETTEISTREGTLVAYEGDVLIRGVEGEVYPCDPEIFARTYKVLDARDDR